MRTRKSEKLTQEQKISLAHDLALGEETQAALARKYSVSDSAISYFRNQHSGDIEKVQEDAFRARTDLWINDLNERKWAYQDIYETFNRRTEADGNIRLKALKQMDELTGQIPPKTNIAIIPVQHMVVDSDGNNLIDAL